MNRKQTAELLPIIKAFSEGRTIECRTRTWELNKGWRYSTDWEETEELILRDTFEYRIKPEPKYRPFANVEECWAEMQKHQPFGWVKNKGSQALFVCKAIGCIIEIGIEDTPYTYKHQFDTYTFADGTPFGIKEEE